MLRPAAVEQSGYAYFVMRGPVNASDPKGSRMSICMKAAVNHSEAISPAFRDKGCTCRLNL